VRETLPDSIRLHRVVASRPWIDRGAPDHNENFAAPHVLYNVDTKLVLTFLALGW